MPTFRSDYPWRDEETDTRFTHGHLPHKSQRGKIYALTFRLADALPPQVIDAYLERLDHMPDRVEEHEPYLRTLRAHLMEALDAGHGTCLLRQPPLRDILKQTIAHHDGRTCDVHAYVIMPNHVHLLLELYPGEHITNVVGSIKRFSALKINQHVGRTGRLWQSEVFDRLVRSYRHYVHTVRYIYNNPRYLHSSEFALYIRPDVWEVLQ